MELKPGYKQTEVGVLPADWEVRPLGGYVHLRTGPFGSALHKSDYTHNDVPVINPMHIVGGSLTPTENMTVTESAARALADFRVRENDILIGRRGDMGRCAVVKSSQAGWLCGTGSMIVRCGEGVDPSFLQRVLSSPRAIAAIDSASVGSTMINLNQSTLSKLLIQIPPLREQRTIAAALSDVDALIGSLDELSAKKRDLKQAAMQTLLTDQTRLPGFNGKWETRRVDEMGEVLAGKALDIYGPGRLRPYLRTKNVLDGYIDLEDLLEMPMTDAEFERFRIVSSDVLLNEGQSLELVGRCSMYRDELASPCAMQNQLLRFRARAHTSPAFAEHLFRYCQHTGVFSAIATQTTSVAHLGSSRFSSLRLKWPSDFAEQSAIATVLSNMDAELAALEQRREKTALLKQGMMQELLTGRTRLV
ncbi:restriction endonuclease subunit S [Corallococcus exiguus]|uniref:restriction endonuclease subunit S n=1 Tax=Corallococcus exiguus TaxID=83462 RepID=UPI003DA2B95D